MSIVNTCRWLFLGVLFLGPIGVWAIKVHDSVSYSSAQSHSLHVHDTFVPPIEDYDFISDIRTHNLHEHGWHLNFEAFGQSFGFLLSANQHLVSSDLMVASYVVEGGRSQPRYASQPFRDWSNLTPYEGKSLRDDGSGKQTEAGWARFVMYSPRALGHDEAGVFEGSFTAFGQMFHVRTVDSYRRSRTELDAQVTPEALSGPVNQSQLMLFVEGRLDSKPGPGHQTLRTSRRRLQTPKQAARPGIGYCGMVDSNMNQNATAQHRKFLDMTKNDGDDIGAVHKRNNAGCPNSRQVLYMAAAADCTYIASYGGTEAALKQIISNWNLASRVYEDAFNVTLTLIQVIMQDECTPDDPLLAWNKPCTDNYTIGQRLSDFSLWRGSKDPDSAGLWHLMTSCSSPAAVGIAWLGMLCANASYSQTGTGGENQFVSGTGVSSIVPVEWKVVAHEIGHNFGAIHDCTSDTCTACPGSTCQCQPCSPGCDCQGEYLMHPTDNAVSSAFSPGTVNTVCAQLQKIGTCLKPSGGLTEIQANTCGNGIREGSEECDCGLDCQSDPCCDGPICKFKNGAKCDHTVDECCSNCQLLSNGTVCRPASGTCDIAEVCNGVSSLCPADRHKPDGSACNVSGAQCASGICTSRDLQCQNYGAALGMIGACPGHEMECMYFCAKGDGTCMSLNNNYLDGTPCGTGGMCYGGGCSPTSMMLAAINWLKARLAFGVAMLLQLGLLLVGSTVSCVARVRRYIKARSRHAKTSAQPMLVDSPTEQADIPIAAGYAYEPDLRWTHPVAGYQSGKE